MFKATFSCFVSQDALLRFVFEKFLTFFFSLFFARLLEERDRLEKDQVEFQVEISITRDFSKKSEDILEQFGDFKPNNIGITSMKVDSRIVMILYAVYDYSNVLFSSFFGVWASTIGFQTQIRCITFENCPNFQLKMGILQ